MWWKRKPDPLVLAAVRSAAEAEERLRLMKNSAGVVHDMCSWALETAQSVGDETARLKAINEHLLKMMVMAKFVMEHAEGVAPKQTIPPSWMPRKGGQQ